MSEDTQVTVKELDAWCERATELRAQADKLEEQKKAINKELGVLKEKIVTALQELDLDKVGFKNKYGLFKPRIVWSCPFPKDAQDKQKIFEHMREQGVYEQYATVNANSFKAYTLAEREAAMERDPAAAITFHLPGCEPPKFWTDLTVPKMKKGEGNE